MRNFLMSLLCLVTGIGLSGCQSTTGSRLTIDTTDGQALPQAVVTGGLSQSTLSRSITVPDGKATKIAFYAFTNPDCSNVGYATVRAVEPPQNGKLEITQEDDFGFWAEKNPRADCNKKRVKGVVVRYNPKAGFTGIDHFVYEAFSPSGGGVRRFALTVNVL